MTVPKRPPKYRKVIRAKIQEILMGQTNAGDRVFRSLASAQWSETLPVIAIYSRSEEVEKYAEAPREYKRSVQFIIEVLASGPEQAEPLEESEIEDLLDDQIDDMCEQIERIMDKDDSLDGVCDESMPTGIEFEFRNDGNIPIGSARMTYQVTYYRMAPFDVAEQDGISDFKKINADWKIGHHDSEPDNVVDAEDSIDIPQS